eukprot:RCo008171
MPYPSQVTSFLASGEPISRVEVTTRRVECSTHGSVGSMACAAFQRSVAAGTARQRRAPWRISLNLSLVVSICVLTVGPAVTLWAVSWQASSNGISDIHEVDQSVVEAATMELRRLTIRSTESAFMKLIQPSEDLIMYQSHRLKGKGLLDIPGPQAVRNYSYILDALGLFFDIRGSRYLSIVNYALLWHQESRYPEGNPSNWMQWTAYTRLNLDALNNNHNPTVYVTDNVPNELHSASEMQYYIVNQDTGQKLLSIYKQVIPMNIYPADATRPEYSFWENELVFNEQTGLTEVVLTYGIPFKDMLAAHHLVMTTNVYTVSSFLAGLLTGPKERLFVFFRTPAGTLIGASHGKYFSHSDVDYSANNPLTNPPPVAEFQRYTPI